MLSPKSYKSISSNEDEDVYKYNFDQDKYIIENSVRSKSTRGSKESGKSLAYYLQVYNKKHEVLAIENNQNNLYSNLKQISKPNYRNNESLMKTNNQLLKSSTDLEFPTYSKAGQKDGAKNENSLLLVSQRSNLEFSSSQSNKSNPKNLVNDFVKINQSNADTEPSILNFKK